MYKRQCKDSDSDSIFCLANIYLAVLYYTTGQYQTAIDHCTPVVRSQDHSQCSSHGVQGELLPKIDDDIDNVLGLAVLYQHLRTAALNQQYQTQYVSVFSTELFAFYFHIKYSSPTKCRSLSISDTEQLFIGDVLLFMSLRRSLKQAIYHEPFCQKSHQPTMNPTEQKASNLVELLQKSAIEHLTTYRQTEAQEFCSVGRIVTTDFEALYAYKRGDYQHCLQLCIVNVHTLLDGFDVADIPAFPEFIQLLDDDILSLTALMLILDPMCRVWSNRYVCISQLTLSLYLMTQCHQKLHQSAMSLPLRTLRYIEIAHRKHPNFVLDQLILKLIKRKIVM